MALVEHAETELRLAGLLDDDSDYNGMLGMAVLDIINVFSGQGHSGMSAEMTTQLVTKLMRFENLTPLTNSPDEWQLIAVEIAGQPGMYQNKRNSKAFSMDGGATFYILGEEPRVMYNSEEAQ